MGNFKIASSSIVIFWTCLTLCIMLIEQSVFFKIILFYLNYFMVLAFNKKNALDPRVFFLGFFVIYSTFYPIKVILLDYSLIPINYYSLSLSLNYSFFFFFSCLLVFELFLKPHNGEHFYDSVYSLKPPGNETLLRYIAIFIILLLSFSIYSSGATSKRDVQSEIGVLASLGNFCALMLLVLFYLNLVRSIKFKFFNQVTVSTFFILLFYMLLTGERDVFFRLCFSLLVVYFAYSKTLNLKKIFLIFLAVVVLVPMSQALKAILINSDELSVGTVSTALIFSNEFVSASRNLYALVYFGVDFGASYLLNDVVRAFIPSLFFSDVNIHSTVSWFHNVYRPSNGFDGQSGWGFTIVGSGYLLGGYFGVFLIAMLVSLSLVFFYNRKYKSILWFVFYLMLLMTSIYTIRTDVANFLSQSYKLGGIYMLFVLISSYLYRLIGVSK
ncbi:O-antigen polymerase [Pseudoalteromonas sp. SSMSWG5]|uniref:O-antigen polymerase n=1 Tax=Pseudoalteromonas sp. SSMSWG5 TaxID=3139396 RepID=UPI003BABE9ED